MQLSTTSACLLVVFVLFLSDNALTFESRLYRRAVYREPIRLRALGFMY